MKCVIYLRVGTEEQLKTESPEETCKRIAEEARLSICKPHPLVKGKSKGFYLNKNN